MGLGMRRHSGTSIRGHREELVPAGKLAQDIVNNQLLVDGLELNAGLCRLVEFLGCQNPNLPNGFESKISCI